MLDSSRAMHLRTAECSNGGYDIRGTLLYKGSYYWGSILGVPMFEKPQMPSARTMLKFVGRKD